MRYALNIFMLLRPHNVAGAVLCVGAGYFLAGHSCSMPWPLLAAAALAVAGGNVINDYYDLDIDSINKPARVLPSGSISRKTAGVVYILLLLPVAALMLRLTALESAWISAWVILLYAYSRKLKRTYLAGNILVSLVAASAFPLGASAAGGAAAGILPALYAFFFVMGRELVKDCEDMEGDGAYGARTVPVVSGKGAALKTSALIFLLLAAAFPLPFFMGIYGAGYAWVIFISVLPILLICFILSLEGKRLGLTSFLLKVGMFTGIVAFLFGSA